MAQMGLNRLEMTAAIWLLSGVLACISADGMVQPLETNLHKLAQWKSSGKALICAERTTTKPGKANVLGNDACPLDFSTGLPQTLLQESMESPGAPAPVFTGDAGGGDAAVGLTTEPPTEAAVGLTTEPPTKPAADSAMNAVLSGEAASAQAPSPYPKCNSNVKCDDKALLKKCKDAVQYETKRFDQIRTVTTGDQLIKEHHLRVFRDCATGLNDAEQLSNQQKKPFLTSSMAAKLCLKLSCQDMKAIVETDRSRKLHIFSGKDAPASMLAVDLFLQKTMKVWYCEKQFCIEKQKKKNETRKRNGKKEKSLKEIEADCKQCDGKQPSGDCNIAENKEKPECNNSCQCFKYKVTKVCEIYDRGKKTKDTTAMQVAVEAKFGSGGLMQNTGFRDLCAMV